MKEITRIHLAKVAYDIEVDAKKDIQQYITALERYADDAELLDDIEIRITELLAERGVVAGGVIAKDDVAAVRVRLGEPSDFAPEGDIVAGRDTDDQARKLYRDMDSAILGGVLAGVARFFKIDPVWTRLIFIILLFPSFGTAVIVYLVMWLIVPPAKTAAEKLQMRGRAVTLDAIKEISENETVRQTAHVIQNVIRVGAAIVILVGAIGVLVATLWIGLGLAFGTDSPSPLTELHSQEAWWVALALGLFVLSGILLATLGFVLANALLGKRWTKRIGTAVVIIITVGLLSFFSGLGSVWYGMWQNNIQYYDSRTVSQVNLPQITDINHLVIEGDDKGRTQLSVEYIVSDKPRYELESIEATQPQFKVEGGMATVVLSPKESAAQSRFTYLDAVTVLRIYGPALDTFEAKENIQTSYYNKDHQEKLEVSLYSTGFELMGAYDSVTVTQRESGVASLTAAAIGDLRIEGEGSLIEAGVVRTLSVTQADVCPATADDTSVAMVRVQAVSSGKLTYNGVEQDAKHVIQDCGTVFIGSQEDYDRYQEEQTD